MFARLLLMLAVFAGLVSTPFAAGAQCAADAQAGECGCCPAMEVSCCMGEANPVQKDVPRQVMPAAPLSQDWIAPVRTVVAVLSTDAVENQEWRDDWFRVKPAASIIDRICVRTI